MVEFQIILLTTADYNTLKVTEILVQKISFQLHRSSPCEWLQLITLVMFWCSHLKGTKGRMMWKSWDRSSQGLNKDINDSNMGFIWHGTIVTMQNMRQFGSRMLGVRLLLHVIITSYIWNNLLLDFVSIMWCKCDLCCNASYLQHKLINL